MRRRGWTTRWVASAGLAAGVAMALSAGAAAADTTSTTVAPTTSTTVAAPTTSTTLSPPMTTTTVAPTRRLTTVKLSAQGPPVPTIDTSPSPNPGKDPTPTWTFTASGGVVTCSLSLGATPVFLEGPCTTSSSQTYNLSGHPDGAYTFTVTVTDLTLATASASSTYTYDTTPPAPPTITSSTPSPGNSRSPSWSFSVDPSTTSTTWSLASGATIVFASASCTSPKSYDLTGKPDGAYTFSVVAHDAAGNASTGATSTYTLLTQPPSSPVIVSGPAATGNDATPTLTFTVDASTASVTCRCWSR